MSRSKKKRKVVGGAAGVSAVTPPRPQAPSNLEPAAAPMATGAWARSRQLAERHPVLLAWLALSIGMVAIVLYTSRDVGLLPSQLAAIVVATIAVAGACVWIIFWD